MKAIVLNTARADNAGRRCPAGAQVGVGPGDDEIAQERAQELIRAGLAVAAGKAKAEAAGDDLAASD